MGPDRKVTAALLAVALHPGAAWAGRPQVKATTDGMMALATGLTTVFLAVVCIALSIELYRGWKDAVLLEDRRRKSMVLAGAGLVGIGWILCAVGVVMLMRYLS